MHTYKNYNRWDKFDVDAALKECDGGTHPSPEPLAPQRLPSTADPMQDMKRTRNRTVVGERPLQSPQAPKQPMEKDADGWRVEGNVQFKKGNYVDAVECYTHSIKQVETVLAYANRGMAKLKLGDHKEAEEDCSKALELDNQFLKAYQRRAVAREALGNLEGAVEDLESAVRLEPSSEAAKKSFLECLEKIAKAEKLQPLKNKVQVFVEVSNKQKSKNSMESERKRPNAEPVLQEVTTISRNLSTEQDNRVKMVHPESNLGEPSQVTKISKTNDSTDAEKDKAKVFESQARVDMLQSTEEKPVSERKSQESLQQNSSHLPVKLPSKAPKSSAEFEAVWKSLKAGSMDEKSAFISGIGVESFPGIFKSSLSPPVLVGVVNCALHTLGKGDITVGILELWTSILEALIKVPRFKMVAMCISRKDRAKMGQAWDAVISTRGDDDEHRNRLLLCRKPYGV